MGDETATSMGFEPPLDGPLLSRLSAGDGRILRNVLADFLREAEVRLASLEEAVAARDGRLVAQEAARLNAAATSIGATPFARAARRLERAQADAEFWPHLLRRTREEHDRLVRFMHGEAP